MISIQIKNQKDFTTKLFANDCFDSLLFDNAHFRVFTDFIIDGRVNSSYFDNDDEARSLSNLPWARFRNICFNIIKGNRKPVSFKIVLKLDSLSVRDFEESEQIKTDDYNINGLYLNIRYDSGSITCITGISASVFSIDKTVERLFDHYIHKYFMEKNIEFDIC